MAFFGELKYEKIEGKESFAGRPVYRLTEFFGYVCKRNSTFYIIYCHEGFETDFASIPEWIFFVRPRNGKWMKASVIHDRACIMARDKEVVIDPDFVMTYKLADQIFYEAMLEDEASLFTANFMYFWCRAKHILYGQK